MYILKEPEKGVSLIATFFILTIILAVVLNISILLYNGIKIVRNVGNSVVAFYAADSGVEKFLYYDRKQVSESGKRGLCYMCDSENPNICSDCTPGVNCFEPNCQDCFYTPLDIDGCNPLICENCEVEFNSFFNGKSYNITARTIMVEGVVSASVDSKGNYENISRKIQLQIEGDEIEGEGQQAPSVIITCLSSRSIPEGTELTIYAEISDPDGVDSVVAYIQSPDENNIGSVDLTGGGGVYTGIWVGGDPEVYYIDIEACDTEENCGITDNIQNQCI